MKKTGFIKTTKTIVADKIKESFSSVLPVALIVLILCFTLTPVNSGIFLAFVLGTILLVVGMGLFTLGADTAMTPIGEYVGASVVSTKKLWLIIPVYFVVGVLITIAEPDLQVLATQLLGAINKWTLIIAVGVGVGSFMVVAFLRNVLNIKLSYILIGFYTIIFVLAIFVPGSFVPMAFDSGGVTTGPMSVPFIMAMGTGVANIRTDKKNGTDGFGMTALCSIGPILAVMIIGLAIEPQSFAWQGSVPVINNSKDLIIVFGKALPIYMMEVGIALLPIIGFFFLFNLVGAKVSKSKLIQILIGILYTYIGLVFFLTGVNVGFLPVGNLLGSLIGDLSFSWVIVPIGFILGFFVVAAEPAVHVLCKQVYEMTSGAISKKALRFSLMIGVGASVGLAMLRILLHIPIMYFLIPGYLIALILTFAVPETFTAIAFDSGGVASGAMTASFLLPLALGFCTALGGNVATEGYGLVAMVAMAPLITIQILGLTYKLKIKKAKLAQRKPQPQTEKEDIIG